MNFIGSLKAINRRIVDVFQSAWAAGFLYGRFLEHGGTKNGWLIGENPVKIDDFGGPPILGHLLIHQVIGHQFVIFLRKLDRESKLHMIHGERPESYPRDRCR